MKYTKIFAAALAAAMLCGNLVQPVSAADDKTMALRMTAETNCVNTDQLKSGDAIIHGGLYIDNYTGISKLRLILKSDSPLIIENGDFTRDPSRKDPETGEKMLAFFETYSRAVYTQESLIDDDTNIISWFGAEIGDDEKDKDYYYENGTVADPKSSFLSYDLRVPKNTPLGDYYCFISERVQKTDWRTEEDSRVFNTEKQLEIGKDVRFIPLKFSVYMRGDVNCDRTVDVTDAQAALNYYTETQVSMKALSDKEAAEIVGTEHTQAAVIAADASMDGTIEVTDAQGILQYYTDGLTGITPDWFPIFPHFDEL